MLHCFSALHFPYNVLICRHGSTHSPFSKNDRISSTLAKSPLPHPPKKITKLIYTPPILDGSVCPSPFLTCFWHLLLATFKMINE